MTVRPLNGTPVYRPTPLGDRRRARRPVGELALGVLFVIAVLVTAVLARLLS